MINNFRYIKCGSDTGLFIAVFIFAVLAGASAKAAELDCDPLDTRVSISSDTEASAELAASTLLKIGKATGNIKGDAKKTINNYVGSNASEFDRVLYLFCGMVGKATDIPTQTKFQMYLQLLQLQKENSQDQHATPNGTGRPGLRNSVKPDPVAESSTDEQARNSAVSGPKRQRAAVPPAATQGTSIVSSSSGTASPAPPTGNPAANGSGKTQFDEAASAQLEAEGDGEMGEAISIGSCVSRNCVHGGYSSEERQSETNASKDKCKFAKMRWRAALMKTAAQTSSVRLKAKLESSSAIKCVDNNAHIQCISIGGVEDVLVDAGGGVNTMPSFHCSENDLWSGRLY